MAEKEGMLMVRSELKELFDLTGRIAAGKAEKGDEKKYLEMSLRLIRDISDMDDEMIMHIIYYRYTLGLCWIRLADICGSFSTDAVRKSCDRKLKKYEIAA